MQDRREYERRGYDEHQPGIQRVEAREELARRALRRVHRAHATEQHSRVQERVDRGQFLQLDITQHSDRQGHDEERDRGA